MYFSASDKLLYFVFSSFLRGEKVPISHNVGLYKDNYVHRWRLLVHSSVYNELQQIIAYVCKSLGQFALHPTTLSKINE